MTAPLPPTLSGAVRIWRGTPRADATLEHMVDIVMDEYQDSGLVEIAVDVVETAEEKNPAAMARAILRWLRLHTRFVPDPVNAQLLKAPVLMLEEIRRDGLIGGDCVDLAMLAASLAMAVGLPAQFIAEAYAAEPNAMHAKLTHVYTVVQTQFGWLNMDTQRPPDAPVVEPVRREVATIP